MTGIDCNLNIIYNFSRSHEEQDLLDVDDLKILGELIDKGKM